VYIDERAIEMNMCKDRDWGKKEQILSAKKVKNITRRRILLLDYNLTAFTIT
jgi:hypothetical protein